MQFTLIHGPNIPGSYEILFLIALDFTFIMRHIHSWETFPLWPSLFVLSEAILPLFLSSILDIFPPGRINFWCHIFLPFILFMRFLRQEYWSGLPFPCPVDHVLSELSPMTHWSWVPCAAWLIASLSYTRLWSMWSVWLAFCDCGFPFEGCGIMDLASWWERLAVGKIGSCSGGQGRAQ